jgi:hypothetical protein
LRIAVNDADSALKKCSFLLMPELIYSENRNPNNECRGLSKKFDFTYCRRDGIYL